MHGKYIVIVRFENIYNIILINTKFKIRNHIFNVRLMKITKIKFGRKYAFLRMYSKTLHFFQTSLEGCDLSHAFR